MINVKCQWEVKLRLGSALNRLGRLPVGVPGVPGSNGFSAIPCGSSFKRMYSLSDPGVDGIFGPLELSNDVNFVEIPIKTTIHYSNLHINLLTYVCHMTVSNLLNL